MAAPAKHLLNCPQAGTTPPAGLPTASTSNQPFEPPGFSAGWDYSTRWFANGQNLTTIRTTKILPAGEHPDERCPWLSTALAPRSTAGHACTAGRSRRWANRPWQPRSLCPCTCVGRSIPPAHKHAFVLPCRPERLPAANGAKHCRLCRRAGLHRASAAVPAACG